MKLVQWVRFTWNFEQLPPFNAVLPEHYHVALATPAEDKELRAVIMRSVTQDTSWGDAIHEVEQMIDSWLERALSPESNGVCLALRHGLRIIGASVVVADPALEDQLTPGPCILMEYRNRGFGTALLGGIAPAAAGRWPNEKLRGDQEQRAGREISLPEIRRNRHSGRSAAARCLVVRRRRANGRFSE